MYQNNREKMKPGDVLWFMTAKAHGGKMIGMAEYNKFYAEPK